MSPLLNIINGYPEGEFQVRFCSKCNAKCCRIGVWIPLLRDEFPKMIELAHKLQRDVLLSMEYVGEGWIWVMSHSPNPCGFLDQDVNKCLIYKDRPQHCRDYYCSRGFRIIS